MIITMLVVIVTAIAVYLAIHLTVFRIDGETEEDRELQRCVFRLMSSPFRNEELAKEHFHKCVEMKALRLYNESKSQEEEK